MNVFHLYTALLILLPEAASGAPETRIFSEHLPVGDARGSFTFPSGVAPLKTDAATKAELKIVSGTMDENSGGVAKLNDGGIPTEDDQPVENFFFTPGMDGGRLLIDLRADLQLQQINTFSRHSDLRAPQVYQLYGSTGGGEKLVKEPDAQTDLTSNGWVLLARVDTRPATGGFGGQYGVSITGAGGDIGRYRYLLFEFQRTSNDSPFANTFYSEIDIIEVGSPAPKPAEIASVAPPILVRLSSGEYEFSIDSSGAPDLTDWAEKELGPILLQWYPKITGMLPSSGFVVPRQVHLRFRDDMGGTPAAAAANQIDCNIEWFRKNLRGEAKGAVVHELVHVAQQYGAARVRNRAAKRPPGWLVEGIADYIRWFIYEPETRGAELTKRALASARYDGSYRVTANFLDWVTNTYDENLIPKLNAAARNGLYEESLWREYTGHTLEELNEQWKQAREERLSRGVSSP
jgi:hypothetical protein